MYSILALIPILTVLFAVPAAAQSGRTFYIDYANGSNSDPGTQASPWKTHPYMQTGASCTGTGSAPGYSHQAGDQFIFKGGDTWPAACFQMTIPSSGTATAQDYYGVCNTGYSSDPGYTVPAACGGASWPSSGWTRPKFELAQTVPTGGTGGNHVIYAGSRSYITLDGFEIADQAISGGCGFGGCDAISFYQGGNSYVEHMYIHGFMTNATWNSSWVPDYSAGGILGNVHVLYTTIDDSAGFGFNAGGTRISGGYQGGGCQNCGEFGYGKFVNTMAACFTTYSCHDSEFTGITQGAIDACGSSGYGGSCGTLGSIRPHTQVIEDDFGGLTGELVYNNWIHDNPGVGVTIYVNYCSYVYNNVLSKNANAYILISTANGSSPPSGLTGYFLNNTVDCSGGTNCFATDSKGTINGTVNLKNNIWITNGTPTSLPSNIATLNQSNNYTMPTSEASANGFTSANMYAPTSSDSHVAGQGLNLVSSLASVMGAMPPLQYDAEGASWFGGTAAARGATWDLGAFIVGARASSTPPSSSKPNPPTALAVSVQ
jgi:hypothetical protein